MSSPGTGASMKTEAVGPAADRLDPRRTQSQLAPGPRERHRIDQQVRPDPVPDDPPPDAAAVDDTEHVVRRTATQQTDHREDVENMEGVDGVSAVGGLGREPAPGRRAGARAEAQLVRAGEGARRGPPRAARCRASTPPRHGRRAGRRSRWSARSARGMATLPRTPGPAPGSGAGRRRPRLRRAARRPHRDRSSPAGWDRMRSGRSGSGRGRPLRSSGHAARRPRSRRDRIASDDDDDDGDGHDGLPEHHGRRRQRPVDDGGQRGRDRGADDEDARHDRGVARRRAASQVPV